MTDNKVTAHPLCDECNRPTIVLPLVKPRARKRDERDMLPKPAPHPGVYDILEGKTSGVVSLVCHRNDIARFEHEEWLLAGDGDVSQHAYVLVRDQIYSIAMVEP